MDQWFIDLFNQVGPLLSKISPVWAAVVLVIGYLLRANGYLKVPSFGLGGKSDPLKTRLVAKVGDKYDARVGAGEDEDDVYRDLLDRIRYDVEKVPEGSDPAVPTEGLFFDREPGEGILATVAKSRAVSRLAKQRGITIEEAQDLVDRVKDKAVAQYAVQSGALGDGRILQRLRDLIEWLGSPEGQSRIEALIAFILKMVALLAPLAL